MTIVPESADVIVIGGGHNGLVAGAYLARAGLRTVVVEARSSVGGTAGSEDFADTVVNICNCDHLTFRTTPIVDELELASHGLRYVDVEPAQYNAVWDDDGRGRPIVWALHHELTPTLDSIGAVLPGEVEGYRRYVTAARPIVELIQRAAAEPPTLTGLTRVALRRRFAGVPRLLSWSRRSAAEVLGSFFGHDALSATAAVTGPMVWGITPTFARTGLGAITHAMRHVGRVGRPIGGSGEVPRALAAALTSAGGTVLTCRRVERIRCAGGAVRGVTLADGTEIDAPIVISACDPHRTFLDWLDQPPESARRLIERWRSIPRDEGYESKIDAVVDGLPEFSGLPGPQGPTLIVAPSLAEIDRGHALMASGRILEQPAMLVNVPSAIDPSIAERRPGHHVFSLEALYTPYRFIDGWNGGEEPRRWLDVFARRWSPGLIERIVDMRAVTPAEYESDFHLPAGHATSFGGGPLAAIRHPHPELTRYETAVDGLYLTGAATFPGAGVWGASGRNCATVVLARRTGESPRPEIG